jgi:hypothetical protein
VVVCCECGNEPLYSIKRGEFETSCGTASLSGRFCSVELVMDEYLKCYESFVSFTYSMDMYSSTCDPQYLNLRNEHLVIISQGLCLC